MLWTVVMVLVLTVRGLALQDWDTPDTIPVACGHVTCDIWTQYCHHGMCMKCSPAACNLPLVSGGRPIQCYFYCMDVKKNIEAAELEERNPLTLPTMPQSFTTSSGQQPQQEDPLHSPHVTPNTVIMVVVPTVTYVAGVITAVIYQKCTKKGNRQLTTEVNNQPPQGRYSGTTDPQEAVELVVSNK
ncbi:uncharacterized protein [Argopecten irradians]|uniref:uncharacterized protein isoform X1 n=1 Tax=Argopecten irradians TaxID=31199 RepID=UPI003719F192